MDLDKKQKKLLKLLSINCRFTNKDIAKAIGVSPDTVSYQVNKLVDEENLGAFTTLFDCRQLGYTYYHVFLRVKRREAIDLDDLRSLPSVMMLAKVFGSFDVQLVILVKDETTLQATVDTVAGRVSTDVQDYMTLRHVEEYRWTQLTPDIDVDVDIPERSTPVYSLNDSDIAESNDYTPTRIDDTDKQIISHLLDNPRVSYLEIARSVPVSRETVRNRVRSYIEDGFLIFFGLVPNYKRRGFFSNALFFKLKRIPPNMEAILEEPYVAYAARMTGEYNLLVYTLDRDPEQFASHARSIRRRVADDVLDMSLLYFEERLKNAQFPLELLQGLA